MRRALRGLLPLGLTAVLACGGATEPTSPSSSSNSGSSSSGGASSSGGQACTTIGCENGARVDFSFREQGTYVFEITISEIQVHCKATLPLPKAPFRACDQDIVMLGLVGSQLPPDQQSIGGLVFTQTPARARIRAERDGLVLGDKTIDFVYQVTPGPNGPNCEPKECKLAKATFP